MTDDCRRIADQLAAYADGLLPSADRAGLERHLEVCPACRVAADAERGGRAVIRARAPLLEPPPLPPGLRTRCEALVREQTAAAQERRQGVRAWRRFLPASVTTLLVAAGVLAALAFATGRSDTLLAAQLTADHSKCFTLFARGEQGAAAALERELADRHGWDVHVPPSSPADGVQLIGARKCVYAEGAVPHIMYRVNGQNVSLFVLDRTSRQPADLVTFGHRARVWTRGSVTFVLVSPAAAGEMVTAARYLMEQAH